MRPTGKLHLGHLFGVLRNWNELQKEYDCFFEVADLHALTTEYSNPQEIRENTIEMVKDWLASGIDPDRSTLFVQSEVMEHTYLHIIFSMLISLSRLLRNPTFKEYIADLQVKDLTTQRKKILDKVAEKTTEDFLEFFSQKVREKTNFENAEEFAILKNKLKDLIVENIKESLLAEEEEELSYGHLVNYGFLGYPILQAADILLYKGELVPVGEDQLPHLELTREIARRFNRLYKPIFPEPQPLLTEFPRVPGLDGKRMSKSRGNTILISENPTNLKKKILSMFTDPQKIKRGDPGHPEICPVFHLHKIFNPQEIQQIETDCKSGELGCVDCKTNLFTKVDTFLAPIRDKREKFTNSHINDILDEGNKRAKEIASNTLQEVKRALNLF